MNKTPAKEIWKWIPGYEGIYKVSSFGRVRKIRLANAYEESRLPDGYLTLSPGNQGYLAVYLRDSKNKQTRCLVHRLVLLAFVGPCPEGMEARHFPDRDPTNNRLDNLSWGTRAENVLDKIKHGTHLKIMRPHLVRVLYYRYKKGERAVLLAKEFGISPSHTWNLIRKYEKELVT